MSLRKILAASAIISILSTSFWVDAIAQTQNQPPAPVSMQGGAPMDPLMMQNMMQMRQQQMRQGQPGRMPMMGGGSHGMMMDPVMRRNMMRWRQQQMRQGHPGNMPMMGAGNNPMMMDPTMRQQHMAEMKQHLSNIETLLTELVELQKKK